MSELKDVTWQDIEALRGTVNSEGNKPHVLQIYDNLHAWADKAKELEETIQSLRGTHG